MGLRQTEVPVVDQIITNPLLLTEYLLTVTMVAPEMGQPRELAAVVGVPVGPEETLLPASPEMVAPVFLHT
jgi:hypothetical protein